MMLELPQGRRERKKRETRARIVGTAKELFLERGYEQTTVADIARALDLSSQTVFNYFPTKDKLLFAIAEEAVEGFETMLVAIARSEGPTLENVVKFVGPQGLMYGPIAHVNRRLYVEVLRVVLTEQTGSDLLARIERAAEMLLERTQQRGEARKDWTAAFMARMIVNTVVGAVTLWLSDPTANLAERLRDCAIFLHYTIRPQTRTGEAPF